MPFNGSGTFQRTFPAGGWQGDAAANIKIKADRHDQHDTDLASGLSNVICKDGQTSITADIPFNGKKITNLGSPINPTDAVNRAYVDGLKTFSTGVVISGSTTNGQITYTGATGPTGLSWTTADVSYGVTGSAGSAQWQWNDKADGTGNNVMKLTEAGALTVSSVDPGVAAGATLALNRASPSPAVNDALGSLEFWGKNSTQADIRYGQIHGYLNDPVAGTEDGSLYFNAVVAGAMATRLMLNAAGVNAYGILTSSGAVVAAQEFTSSTAALCLNTTGAGAIYLRPNGQSVSTNQGTYDSAGGFTAAGGITAGGQVTAGGNVQANGAVFGGNGALYLRPNGVSNGTSQALIDVNGGLTLTGVGCHINTAGHYNTAANIGIYVNANYKCKNGVSGGFGSSIFNWFWDGVHNYSFVDNTNIGWVTVNSDYRIKKDIADLPSTWDRVKALHPISYSRKEFDPPKSEATLAAMEEIAKTTAPDPNSKEATGPLFKNDDAEQWGFIAHEAQETLLPTAATGTKDMLDGVQSLDWAPILAATVKALQEAMARIEALEAKP